ncbi:MAG: hypothetical protein ACLRT4_18070 [Thomasclavelia sp.]
MSVPTVSFDNYNSADDFGMILSDYEVSPAVKKTHFISVPGRNGDLDVSSYLGESYENRTITITLNKRLNIDNLPVFQSELENKINGKRMEIIFSNDSSYYWIGLVSLNSITKLAKYMIEINISCNVDPFKISKTDGELSL